MNRKKREKIYDLLDIELINTMSDRKQHKFTEALASFSGERRSVYLATLCGQPA